MRNVKRTDEPETLVREAPGWRKRVQELKLSGKQIPDSLMNKYNQPEIKEALKTMYSDNQGGYCCCYCESPIGVVDYPHIEHRWPKSIYEERAFDWDNLHLACQKCNMHKGDQWDDAYPILDAVLDVPIANHLSYDSGGRGVYRKDLQPRGTTTVKHADLNRDELLQVRLYLYADIVGKICRIKKNPGGLSEKQQLQARCKGAYGSMVKYLVDTLCPECWDE